MCTELSDTDNYAKATYEKHRRYTSAKHRWVVWITK